VTSTRISRARSLRRRSTDAEWKVWSALRNRQIDDIKFRRQVPIGRYFADFASFEARVIVELDGSQHQDRPEADAERTRDLEAMGWRVIRFDNAWALLALEGLVDVLRAELRLARA
jgi:very-short-patch-repair endonuclease